MIGSSDGRELPITDPFNGRKVKHINPRATSSSPDNSKNTSVPTHHYFTSIHSTDLFALNHHRATEESNRDFNSHPLVSPRWNPTPEQLHALEEMYQCGIRTPSTDQIKIITARLRRFGKIEGKNVFYWFQNHKARERQKRRRQLELSSLEQLSDKANLQRKESGFGDTCVEAEETKNWAPPSNGSTVSEETGSMPRMTAAESRINGATQLDIVDLQQKKKSPKRSDTWHTMMESSSSPPTDLLYNQSNSMLVTENDGVSFINPEYEMRETQTLQLFPPQSNEPNYCSLTENIEMGFTELKAKLTPAHFFEFL